MNLLENIKIEDKINQFSNEIAIEKIKQESIEDFISNLSPNKYSLKKKI